MFPAPCVKKTASSADAAAAAVKGCVGGEDGEQQKPGSNISLYPPAV